ncbi:MAG: BamA/TamA family outer membrane protein [Myxococcota bacterium]
MLPALGYSSDTGVSVGLASVATRFGREPFRWQVSGQVSVSLAPGPDGVEVPLTDNYLRVDVPGEGGRRLRAELTWVRQSDSGWYGLGNASPPELAVLPDPTYVRTWPAARLELWRPLGPVRGFGGVAGSYDTFVIDPDSRLARDLAGASGPLVAEAVVGAAPHGVVEAFAGVMYDRRDAELWPTSGALLDGSARAGVSTLGDPYLGLNLGLRGYRSLGTPRVVAAARVLGDALAGDPPFYELARYGGAFPAFGPGGQFGPRGVPLQRYHGAGKVLANVELRTQLVGWHLLGLDWQLGPLVFADAGRVWARLGSTPALDGAGLGLHTGAGGGLRLRMGEAVVVRGDFAWSPEGTAAYFDLGNVF